MPRDALAHAQSPVPDYELWSPQAILTHAIRERFPGRIALVSSFGAESVVLLHMVAAIDRHTPVLFGQTQMLFSETLVYQQEVAERLGLTDVRHLTPDAEHVAGLDPAGDLNQRDNDACCHIRKVLPLENGLAPFAAWINGRKRGQSASRAGLTVEERDGAGRVKLNPLADWSVDHLLAYFGEHDLPKHPLVARGYPSIGCLPCTTPVKPGEDPRAGRWRGKAKEECGIHIVDGKIVRLPVAGPAPMDRF